MTWPSRRLLPAVGVGAALTVGYDFNRSIWSANAPWVPEVYQNVLVGASTVGLTALVVCSFLASEPAAARPTRLRFKIFACAGAALVLLLGVSIATAIAAPLAIARTAEVGLGLLAVGAAVRHPDLARWIIVGFALLLVLQLPLMLLQEATQSTFPIGTLVYHWPSEQLASAPGADVLVASDGSRWQRALGSFPHPNLAGGFVALSLILLLPWFARSGQRWRDLGLLIGLWAVGWLELLLSFSRSALLALLLAVGLWSLPLLVRSGTRQLVALLALPPLAALVVILFLAGPYLLPRIGGATSLSSTTPVVERLSLARLALSLIAAHPASGIGAGNFSLAELQPPYDAVSVEPVHAVPVLVMAEAGIPAGVAWLALLVGPIVGRWRTRGRLDATFLASLGVPVGLLTISLLDHYLWSLGQGRAIFFLTLAVWFVETNSDERRGGPVESTSVVTSSRLGGGAQESSVLP